MGSHSRAITALPFHIKKRLLRSFAMSLSSADDGGGVVCAVRTTKREDLRTKWKLVLTTKQKQHKIKSCEQKKLPEFGDLLDSLGLGKAVDWHKLCKEREQAVQQQQQAEQEQQQQKDGLVDIPRELRDTIWSMVVHSDHEININSTLVEPAILQASRQIRHEARKRWLADNTWTMCVRDNDTRLLRSFDARMSRVNRLSFWVCFHRSCNWDNLVEHMRAVWAGQFDFDMCADMPMCSGLKKEHRAVWCFAVKLAKDYRYRSWASCEAMLRQLQEMIGVFDPCWTTDRYDTSSE